VPLTPADVATKKFSTKRMGTGYDQVEVDGFLDDIEAEFTQHLACRFPDVIVVVDKQNGRLRRRSRSRRFEAGPSSMISAADKRLTVVPAPGTLSILAVPPLWVAKPYTWLRPSPVPSPTGLVVKKGSNALRATSGSIPDPVSATEMRA